MTTARATARAVFVYLNYGQKESSKVFLLWKREKRY